MTTPTNYTVREAAEYLNVTPHTVYRLIYDQKLRAFKVGRAVRIPATELARLTTTTEQQ